MTAPTRGGLYHRQYIRAIGAQQRAKRVNTDVLAGIIQGNAGSLVDWSSDEIGGNEPELVGKCQVKADRFGGK